MNAALLIIDVQKAYMKDRRQVQSYNDTFEYINETAALFRRAQKPVIIVRDISCGDGEEYENVPELRVEKGDIEILKSFNNAFWQTKLDEMLKERGVDFLVLCGNTEEYCVLATYNGAAERGYGVSLLQNGIFAAHPEGLMDAYLNRSLISYGALKYFIR
jgi:nicotinamidase-related amidase